MEKRIEVKETGKYLLLEDYVNRRSISTGTIPKGCILNITQIDIEYHKVMIEEFGDWKYWSLPIRKLNHEDKHLLK